MINPDEVFAEVDKARNSGELSKEVTRANIVYQASDRQGFIEQINRQTGERRTGTFTNGHFIQLAQDT